MGRRRCPSGWLAAASAPVLSSENWVNIIYSDDDLDETALHETIPMHIAPTALDESTLATAFIGGALAANRHVIIAVPSNLARRTRRTGMTIASRPYLTPAASVWKRKSIVPNPVSR